GWCDGLRLEGKTRSDNGWIARYRLRCGRRLSRGRLFGRHRLQKRGEASICGGTPVKIRRDRVRGKAIDLSLPGAAAALADAYSDTDILINNAGAIPSGDIFEVDEARWRAAWDLKVFGYINLMRAMFAHMRGHPPKVILNVIGMGAERPQWR